MRRGGFRPPFFLDWRPQDAFPCDLKPPWLEDFPGVRCWGIIREEPFSARVNSPETWIRDEAIGDQGVP